MSRHVRALLSVFAAAVGVIGDASCASAGAPDQQGWWTLTNVGLASQTGLAVPAPPAPAGVPANGLLIEGGSGPDSPIAYAAVVYSVPVAASARSLTLTVATGSVSAPASTLRICRLVNPIPIAEQGGPMGDAPAYDCSHSATAGPSADGTSYRFEVAPLVTDGNLAVAILPTTATDRVVFDQPDSKSLMVTAGPTPSNPAESSQMSALRRRAHPLWPAATCYRLMPTPPPSRLPNLGSLALHDSPSSQSEVGPRETGARYRPFSP
jgi:hypothetical protein